MEKLEQLYEGKAKKIYATNDPDFVIVDYKDDATAFNGEKKGTIVGKGVINNRLTNHFMKMLEENGIQTHFIKEISDRETVVKKVKIIMLEVIVRNIAAGSFSKRFCVKEGVVLKQPSIEFSLKNDDLGDPLINTSHVLALGLASAEDIAKIKEYAFKVNDLLKNYLLTFDSVVVDFILDF
ncbi:MAG: phosphoribosylaminoimidazolesuccinocarboxamide synthase, partial [Oscillospiraceae bacterium]|nr:phosphoribosylaminoimidazolesuccinocarboxamide synthase [Oscillospiraceae bacterium]